MKSLLIFVTLAVSVMGLSAAPADDNPKCRAFCTMDFRPVCAYDGHCYQLFSNACAMDYAKCTGRSNLHAVDDMTLCEKDAANTC